MRLEYPEQNTNNLQEQAVGNFESQAEQLGQSILRELEDNYPESKFEYHNMPHSRGVGNRAVEFLQTEGRIEALTRLIGYTHDYVQDCQDPWPSRGEGKVGVKRVRKTGVIEQQSLEVLLSKCQESGLDLTPEERAIAEEAIRATIPGWSMELGTVTQPELKPKAHDVTFAIAAADIASAGYDPEHFLADGDNVFNEDNALPQPETLSNKEAEQLLKDVLEWSGIQIKYAEGQKILWNRDFIPDFIKSKLTRFDESIEVAEQRLVDRLRIVAELGESAPQVKLKALLDDMGFTRYI